MTETDLGQELQEEWYKITPEQHDKLVKSCNYKLQE